MQQPPRRILALETSGQLGGAALADADRILASGRITAPMRHAAELMPLVQQLLDDTGWSTDSLTDVFVSVGPGSFTGLRIGVTLARTLAWAVGSKVVAVPTLDVIAANAGILTPPPERTAVMLDAKGGRVFAAAFAWDDGRYRCTHGPEWIEPAAFLTQLETPAVLGEGVLRHRDAIEQAQATILDQELWPPQVERVVELGITLAQAGSYADPGQLLPLYLRRPEAEEKWERMHGKDYAVPQRRRPAP